MPPTVPVVAVIELVIELPVQPVGNVHVYPVAPVTAITEYAWLVFAQAVLTPDITPGCDGAVPDVTDRVLAVLLPQVLFAITDRIPPDELVVTVIEFVVELPVQPAGKVQV